MYCTNCGTKIAEGHKFCTNCGKNIAVADGEVAVVALPEIAPEVEAPKKAGLDVVMLVWSIMCLELCLSLFSVPAIILTVVSAFNTEEEAAPKLKIAKSLNIIGMICFAAYFALILFIISMSFFVSL